MEDIAAWLRGMLRDREPLRDRVRARGDDPDCEAARILPYSYLHAAVQEVVLEDNGYDAFIYRSVQRAVRGLHARHQLAAPGDRGGDSDACPVCLMDYGGDEVWPWPHCGHRLHRDCHLALMAAASNPRCPQRRIDQDGHLARTRCEHNRWDFCDQGMRCSLPV